MLVRSMLLRSLSVAIAGDDGPGSSGAPGRWFRRAVVVVMVFSLVSAAFMGGRWYEDREGPDRLVAELEMDRRYSQCFWRAGLDGQLQDCSVFKLFTVEPSVGHGYPGGRICHKGNAPAYVFSERKRFDPYAEGGVDHYGGRE